MERNYPVSSAVSDRASILIVCMVGFLEVAEL
jgi:hypothetical protein